MLLKRRKSGTVGDCFQQWINQQLELKWAVQTAECCRRGRVKNQYSVHVHYRTFQPAQQRGSLLHFNRFRTSVEPKDTEDDDITAR